MSVKAVLFDLDDTLLWDERSVQEAFAATCAYAEQVTGIAGDQLEEQVRKEAAALYASYESFPFTQMIGINPYEALWAQFREGEQEEFRKLQSIAPAYRAQSWTRGLLACGTHHPELGEKLGEMFAAERRNRPIVYDETFAVLEQLKGKYQLLMLTNGSPDLQNEKIDAFPQLRTYFDHIVISGQFGEGKPAKSIFRHAVELLNIRPEEGLMVGDKLTTDIKGALSVGMPCAWINRHRVTRTDQYVPTYEIHNLNELEHIIEQM